MSADSKTSITLELDELDPDTIESILTALRDCYEDEAKFEADPRVVLLREHYEMLFRSIKKICLQ